MKLYSILILSILANLSFGQNLHYSEWHDAENDTIVLKLENSEFRQTPSKISNRFVKLVVDGQTFMFMQSDETLNPIHVVGGQNSFKIYVYIDSKFTIRDLENADDAMLLELQGLSDYQLQPCIIAYSHIRYNFLGKTVINYVLENRNSIGYFRMLKNINE